MLSLTIFQCSLLLLMPITDNGTITTSLPPDPCDVLDLADGIEKSVAVVTDTDHETYAP